jgi:hypothetical protein
MPAAELVSFDYSAVTPADRLFLKDKVGVIRHLSRQCAESVIHIGRHLCEVRDRLPRAFLAWVDTEFSWARSSVYNMMNAAEAFGGVSKIWNKFDASAMFVLSNGGPAVATAREHCIELAKEGEHVTHQTAKELIAVFKDNPQLTPKDVKEYFRNRPKEDPAHPDAEPDDLHGDFRTLWLAFRKLFSENMMIEFSRETANVNDNAETSDENENVVCKLTVWNAESGDRTKAKPRVHSSTSSLESLLLDATDSHPMRRCTGPCGELKRLYEDFSRKKGNRFNRNRACKRCEVPRVKEAKRRKKEAKRDS